MIAVKDIKKGDTVMVLTGKDRGKTGKVSEVLPKEGKIVVEGLNIHVRFTRPKRRGEKGQRLEFSVPIWSSKAMLVCPSCGKTTRVAHKETEAGKLRVCKKCGKNV